MLASFLLGGQMLKFCCRSDMLTHNARRFQPFIFFFFFFSNEKKKANWSLDACARHASSALGFSTQSTLSFPEGGEENWCRCVENFDYCGHTVIQCWNTAHGHPNGAHWCALARVDWCSGTVAWRFISNGVTLWILTGKSGRTSFSPKPSWKGLY